MNFSEALKAMKMGNKVSREAWRGTISYWFMSEDANNEPLIMEMKPSDDTDELVENVSLEDILAEDWWIVVSDGMGKVHDKVSENLPEIGG